MPVVNAAGDDKTEAPVAKKLKTSNAVPQTSLTVNLAETPNTVPETPETTSNNPVTAAAASTTPPPPVFNPKVGDNVYAMWKKNMWYFLAHITKDVVGGRSYDVYFVEDSKTKCYLSRNEL